MVMQQVPEIAQNLTNTVHNLGADVRNEQISGASTLLEPLGVFAEKLTAILAEQETATALAWCHRWVSRMNSDAAIWTQLNQLESGPEYLAEVTAGYNQLAVLLGADVVTLHPPKVHLDALDLHQFSVFSELKLSFSPGLNVFLGENGAGKTHLLKLAFTLCRALNAVVENPALDLSACVTAGLSGVFRCTMVGQLVNFLGNKSSVQSTFKNPYDAQPNQLGFKFASISHQVVPDVVQLTPTTKILRVVFIPTKEMVSIHPGFLTLFEERRLAFDETYRDIAQSLDKLPLVNPPPLYAALKAILSAHVTGELKRTQSGFVVTSGDREMLAALEAEGIRKILMLLYLVQNGEISEDAIVFWDEPEANTNAKLLAVLAALLAQMARSGVRSGAKRQQFGGFATHYRPG